MTIDGVFYQGAHYMKRVVIGLAIFSLSGCGFGYNRIQTYDENINAFKSQIEVQLQRRSDLIPNLVATVRGFADQEEEVFTSIAEARSRLGGAIQSGSLGQMAEANQSLTQGLGRLLVISEAYPELRSNQNFMELQVQLEGTENRIATARQDYNDAVRTYNGFIRRFPQVLTAKATGAEAREYFEITSEEVRDVPTVSFE
jgi:LemA protein